MNSTTDRKPKHEIDLNKVQPLDHHRSAVSFNCLILKMTEILNSFGNRMEDVLERAEQSLDIADRKLRLMEAKLSTVHLEKQELQMNVPTTSKDSSIGQENISHTLQSTVTSTSSEPVATPAPIERKEFASSVVLIKDDPAYSKYFKMLKMGVPEAGVIQKMESEGIDPSLLKRGEDASNTQEPKASGYESSGESVSSFSDSD